MMSDTAPEPAIYKIRAVVDQDALERLGELLALKVQRGWLITLRGDLGAGKTTFARALIRAVLGNPDADVPSPTFALVQNYAGERLAVHHYDLYRLADAQELDELGLDDALDDGAVLMEWPDRAGAHLPADRIDVMLSERPDQPDYRDVTLLAYSRVTATALRRIDAIAALLSQYSASTGAEVAAVCYLQGDASARTYARLQTTTGQSSIIMDSPAMPDGPPIRDGKPYSRIAHLAESIRPFVAIAHVLKAAGFSVPHVLAEDITNGILVLEDLGDRVFGREIARDCGPAQAALWQLAVEALVALRVADPATQIRLPSGLTHQIPAFDAAAMAIEVELLLDWYWPAAFGQPAPPAVREAFDAAWAPIFARLSDSASGWILRDYHSPNLMYLPDRDGIAQVGIIDFQDALRGHWAYDLVSLLQDARVDVPSDLERDAYRHYCARLAQRIGDFDTDDLQFAYAAFGAQRATKIIGIFVRLAVRDSKPAYLAHLPRLWRYLASNLRHPELAPVRHWFDAHIHDDARTLKTVQSQLQR
ncbi:MAG: tRNA (adenosine(37)-N6)-threonylcarbamoyltransferase complex ATPase subunit type 1 TsaE [Pseudomonadota bacterium]